MLKNENKGFTLVELSIVIVIIGLITAGVIGAQSLMDTARNQEIMKDLQSFDTAAKAFKLEYGGLPGDFNEAEDYWGSSNTANGDGNGMIGTAFLPWEGILFWNHLALAEIIPGSYDHDTGSDDLIKGVTTPETGAPHKYFAYNPCEPGWDCDEVGSWMRSYFNKPIQVITVASDTIDHGALWENSDFERYITGLSNKDVRSIDKKMDDGNPFTGNIAAPVCTVSAKEIGADFYEAVQADDFGTSYLVSETDKNCHFFYLMSVY